MKRNMFLLVLILTVHFTAACQENVPQFDISDTATSTPANAQGLIPDFSFGCDGRVRAWRVCLASDPTRINYYILLQIWRPADSGCYTLVGSNKVPSNNSDVSVYVTRNVCISYPVPLEQQIEFRVGDIVGFYIGIDAATLRITDSAESGFLVNTNENATAFVAERIGIADTEKIYAISSLCVSPVSLLPGRLQLQTQITGAPLINAVVEVIEAEDTLTTTTDTAVPTSMAGTLAMHTTGTGAQTSVPTLPVSMRTTMILVQTTTETTRATENTASGNDNTPSTTDSGVDPTPEQLPSIHPPPGSNTDTKDSLLISGSNTETKDSLLISHTTAIEHGWLLRPSDSSGPIETTMGTGEAGSTSSGNTLLAAKTKYILLAVGVALAIVCFILATTAVICVWRSKTKKRRGSLRARASNVSDFVYNSVYTGVIKNLRPNSTGYHSHWSLKNEAEGSTHLEMEPVHIYDEVSDNKNYYSTASIVTKGRASNIYEEAVQARPRQVTIESKFQRIREECLKSTEDTTKQSSVQETNLPKNNTVIGQCNKVTERLDSQDCEDIYDNPTVVEDEEEGEGGEEGEGSTENVFRVYYSTPAREIGSTSIFITENEAYESSGVSEENTSGTSTDSVYYTSPTLISSEEFEVFSNLAYKSTPNS